MKGSHLAGTPADEAIIQLMNDHADRIYRLGLRLCDDPDRAQDLLQETFIRALEGWDRFDGRSRPSTWLHTIATRTCQRMRRRRAGEPRRMTSLEQALPSGEPTVMALPAKGESPLESLEREEVVRAVRAAVGRLPVAFRLPVVLKEMEGMPVRSAADVLGLKVATVKTRLHRARLMIREELAGSPASRSLTEARSMESLCLDLLWAKQEAIERKVEFPIPGNELCERCNPAFGTLDLASDTCCAVGNTKLPERALHALRELVMD
jgi:RNA polymerase sigma-70 factor (ECF subfamily)